MANGPEGTRGAVPPIPGVPKQPDQQAPVIINIGMGGAPDQQTGAINLGGQTQLNREPRLLNAPESPFSKLPRAPLPLADASEFSPAHLSSLADTLEPFIDDMQQRLENNQHAPDQLPGSIVSALFETAPLMRSSRSDRERYSGLLQRALVRGAQIATLSWILQQPGIAANSTERDEAEVTWDKACKIINAAADNLLTVHEEEIEEVQAENERRGRDRQDSSIAPPDSQDIRSQIAAVFNETLQKPQLRDILRERLDISEDDLEQLGRAPESVARPFGGKESVGESFRKEAIATAAIGGVAVVGAAFNLDQLSALIATGSSGYAGYKGWQLRAGAAFKGGVRQIEQREHIVEAINTARATGELLSDALPYAVAPPDTVRRYGQEERDKLDQKFRPVFRARLGRLIGALAVVAISVWGMTAEASGDRRANLPEDPQRFPGNRSGQVEAPPTFLPEGDCPATYTFDDCERMRQDNTGSS